MNLEKNNCIGLEDGEMMAVWSILYMLFGSLVFILGLNLLNIIPNNFQDIYKVSLPVIFLILAFASQRYFPDQKKVFVGFFLVSVGWLLDNYLTGEIAKLLSLNSKELIGIASIMVISMLLVSTPVLVGWRLFGYDFPSLYFQGPNKLWGIYVGLAGLLLFGGLGVLQAQNEGVKFGLVLGALPLALVFSLANAFREELVYRAVFLETYQANVGVFAAVLVTTVVFAAAHIEVNYQPADLIVFSVVLIIIGVVASLIMLKTGSLIGAVLFHAGADVLLIMGMISSGQLLTR